jgi:hypothetical protein
MASPRRRDIYANAIRGFSPESVRYIINPNLPHILVYSDQGVVELPQTPHAHYLVNINERNGHSYAVTITCPQGNKITGCMEWGVYFPFQIVDPKAELYDGRFNCD